MRTTNFKPSEIGPIPADWEVRTIGEMACVCTGNSNTQDKVDTGKYPFYVRSPIVEHINEYGFDTEGVVTVGDGVGTGKVFHYVDGKFALHQRCYLIDRFCPLLDSKYFYKIFSSRFYDRVMQMTAKSSVDSVRREMITGMLIPVPPLPEQRRIAAVLSDADVWIESLDKLIEKKKLVKQGTMQALLSGKSRLPGFSGKWVERRLGECGVFRKGTGISREDGRSGSIPAVRYGELYTHHDCIIQSFASHISEAVASRATLLKPGDILFACSGETKEEIGKCAAFIQPIRAYAGGDLLIMTPKPTCCDSMFLGYALNASQCQAQKAAAGQGDAVVHIHKQALESIEISLPSTLAEQRAIAEVLSDMDAELAALSREKAKAEQIKQGMMQELLTGRVRLAEGE